MLKNILADVRHSLGSCVNHAQLEEIKVKFLGKSSAVNLVMKQLGDAALDERKKIGQEVNEIKSTIQKLIEHKRYELEQEFFRKKIENEKLDMTLPPRVRNVGTVHPVSRCLDEFFQIFAQYGFVAVEGPDIEDDWHNFGALNMDEMHPARQMHDTFYLRTPEGSPARLLRTHTSNVQIRTMKSGLPPFRVISAGRVYRADSDMTHTPVFHQIEGLVLAEGLNMGHLKFVIMDFIRKFFERDNIQIRFRPSFFPFTEPSAEVDIKIEGSDKWLEVLGCGMVHPNVVRNVNIDPAKYQGLAFGMGVERFAMLKYGIKDLRKCFEPDKRWLEHYSFKYFDIPTLAGGLSI